MLQWNILTQCWAPDFHAFDITNVHPLFFRQTCHNRHQGGAIPIHPYGFTRE
ncbi:Uncharacterised protein [Vibrio cholerae]|nr:Uncharacterised protein [Vibrio cholerae]